ncbi:MAG: HIT family protein [Candidatus Dormibacteria bacterium]
MPTPGAQTADCVFCAIVRGDAPATFLHQDELVVAFMDVRPVQPGHLLVVPRAHAKLIPELDGPILSRLWSVATDLNRALRASTLIVEAVSVYVADGDAAGQEVPHVHIHLIPRRDHDGFGLRFPPGYGAEPGRPALETIASRIRPGISESTPPQTSDH